MSSSYLTMVISEIHTSASLRSIVYILNYKRNFTFLQKFKWVDRSHPAGDVLWVFVEPGNVVP